ncbi:MAG: DNA repair protein RecO [Propionibacteriaceae bacterium]|jgi:DNA repair protein RecO (recombination protein O)|nr:DNA repair protein RecO [Propionibacteriaceae bacterium]
MATYRDEAVVLRTHKLGEADRIITLLCREHGKVRAVAKGVRRTSSKFGARLEPFTIVDLQLYTGRNLDTVTQAVTLAATFEAISSDYGLFTAAQVMAETADRVVAEERQPALQQYLLLSGALRALVNGTTAGPRPATVIMDSYLLRSLATAGYAPTLTDCARCGASGDHESFSVPAGGVVCQACRPVGSVHPRAGTIEYLRALLTGDWPATLVDEAVAKAASGIVSAFTTWHLERGLRSLSLAHG